jgi:hypothetical protein
MYGRATPPPRYIEPPSTIMLFIHTYARELQGLELSPHAIKSFPNNKIINQHSINLKTKFYYLRWNQYKQLFSHKNRL